MASLPSKDADLQFGFSDLNGFKDFVVFVLSCAPDLFPYEDWKPPDQQMDLDRAFLGLHHGLDLTAKETGSLEIAATCRRLVDGAYANYKAGLDTAGQQKLEELERILKAFPSP